MAGLLRYAGRVVLVTGAGNGLGKEYALAFGARGAKVVVNDLGGDIKGEGKSSRPADLVVEEIRSKGGVAVANYDSVEEGEKLVKAVLDNFGRIDVIVNNAGILRDRSFARITDTDWDIIHRIHLRSVFLISRAAWPHMRDQKYGRILNVTSAAGIYGNFGQANYSAAKLGIVGLTNTLALEGAKSNIFVNAIAPIAGSRLTQTVMPDNMIEALKPQYVAPFVLWLCHEDCTENGGLYEVGAGWAAKLRWQRSLGAVVRQPDREMTPEDIRNNWAKIVDFANGDFPSSITEANMSYFQTLQKFDTKQVRTMKTSAQNTVAGAEAIVNAKYPVTTFSYSEREAILYALGVGVSTKHEGFLKFLFEMSDDFSVLPTYAVIPAMASVTNSIVSGDFKGFKIDPAMILHGEQYLELFKCLKPNDTLTSKSSVVDVLDKGSGAVIICNVDTFDSQGNKVAFNQTSTFVQRAGGFGGKRTSEKAVPIAEPPKRNPDASIQEKTSVDQAALYRLSGDSNPLHIDPSFSALGGFETPILHGLASFGFSARHVLKQYCNNDVSKFKAIKVRFSNPVLPGQTLQTDMWKEGSRVFFQSKVVETGKMCLTGAYVDLFESSTPTTTTPSSDSLKSTKYFNEIKVGVSANPGLVKTINAVYLYNITQGGATVSQWTIDLKTGGGDVYNSAPRGSGKADCTLTISDDDFEAMAMGKLNGQKAFSSGQLKVTGNVMLAMKLELLMRPQAKL